MKSSTPMLWIAALCLIACIFEYSTGSTGLKMVVLEIQITIFLAAYFIIRAIERK